MKSQSIEVDQTEAEVIETKAVIMIEEKIHTKGNNYLSLLPNLYLFLIEEIGKMIEEMTEEMIEGMIEGTIDKMIEEMIGIGQGTMTEEITDVLTVKMTGVITEMKIEMPIGVKDVTIKEEKEPIIQMSDVIAQIQETVPENMRPKKILKSLKREAQEDLIATRGQTKMIANL